MQFAAVLRTPTSSSSTIKIGHYLLLIESITYVEVFPETIIIIIIVSSSPVCFIAHCVVSIEIECAIVILINTSSEPELYIECAKVNLCEDFVFRLSSGEERMKRRRSRKKQPFEIVLFAINNCHFTDSPTPSIYLSTTYTTPYLYCRSFNRNRNDRTSTIDRMNSNKKNNPEKNGQFRRFLFIFSVRSGHFVLHLRPSLSFDDVQRAYGEYFHMDLLWAM